MTQKRQQRPHSSLKTSILIGAPLVLLSLGTGFIAYKILNPSISTTTTNSQVSVHQSTDAKTWPDVQFLADSGLRPLTRDQIDACKRILDIPTEVIKSADNTNFGKREPKDVLGRSIPNEPSIIVLHETVIPAEETVRLFQTPHPNDADQASYHLLIDREGRLIRIVPDAKRAFGSGFSKFGDFTIYTKAPDRFSINNVALHVSMESPGNGQSDNPIHSGYTPAQYKTLAKQVLIWQAEYGIPVFRITTHSSVDRSHSRYDPRGFSLARWDQFDTYHREYASTCGLNQFTLPT